RSSDLALQRDVGPAADEELLLRVAITADVGSAVGARRAVRWKRLHPVHGREPCTRRRSLASPLPREPWTRWSASCAGAARRRRLCARTRRPRSPPSNGAYRRRWCRGTECPTVPLLCHR